MNDDDPMVCAACARLIPETSQADINLTPDGLFVEMDSYWPDVSINTDDAVDWCSIDCFHRWLYMAVTALSARHRP